MFENLLVRLAQFSQIFLGAKQVFSKKICGYLITI